MEKYVAYVDESGCKLNAKTIPQDNSDIGVGVAVAVALPQNCQQSFETAVRNGFGCPLKADSHIVDFDADSQNKARKTVFTAIKSCRAVVLYEAITAEGFHRIQHVIPEDIKRRGAASRRGPVRVSDSHDNPRMHAELLANVMTKVRAFVADESRDPTASHIAFLVDQVDGPILDDAKARMAEIDSVGNRHTHCVTGFDTEKKSVVKGEIASSVKGLDDLELPRYTVDISPKTNYGIFAADVVANTLFRHFRDLIASSEKRVRLNQREAVSGFEIHDCIVGFSNLDASDILYGFKDTDRSE